MTTQMFGAPIKRREDPRLVTGGGRYLDDLGHDALEAAFVRSPHAHARIIDIDVADAIGKPAAAAEVEAFVKRHPELNGDLELPGLAQPVSLNAGKIAETTITGAEIGTLAGVGEHSVGKGLGIGSAAGAAGGLIWVLATRGREIVLRPGTDFELQLTAPLTF